jgi:hypothetical protein
MARLKIFDQYKLPKSVVQIVRAQCADYERRENAIRSGDLNAQTEENYRKTNEIIREALFSCEEQLRKDILNDIAACRGYDKSKTALNLSYHAYYRRKTKAIFDIAKKMYLI